MTSKLKCPFCGQELIREGMNHWWCSCNIEHQGKELYGTTALWQALIQAKQDLEIARKALEYYADSRFGKKQDDGTYALEIDKGCGVTIVYTYDPRPAKQAIDHIAGVSKMVGQN
jgi:hypothetical protein